MKAYERTIKFVHLGAQKKKLKSGKEEIYYRISLPPEVGRYLGWDKGDLITIIFLLIKKRNSKDFWYPYRIILENETKHKIF